MSALTEEPEAPQAERSGGAPTRDYKVLEQIELTDGVAYAEVFTAGGELKEGTVTARNTNNAYRKAFKAMRTERGAEFDEATLIVVPAGQWRPTPVKAEKKESITVAVG